jgi:peptidoglycan hydrolase-like protein with peptidoglycan-binding domain
MKNIGTSISKFYRSFSGTDTIAFLIFPGINPITIGSLTTISYSMYRNKVPVINIGRTNINGITRGSRIYAGTMVFTLINKHWLRELQDQADYLADFPTLKTDELPLFDIMIVSANEYGSACSMFIYGVDLTDEAQTLSIEDLFTENVFKFVAREVSVFDKIKINDSDIDIVKYYTVSTGQVKNYYIEEQPEYTKKKESNAEIKPLSRTLYLVTNGTPMIGEDVAAVQQLLNMAMSNLDLAITYRFDRLTEQAVKDFQSTNGLLVNGIVDNSVYTKLLQNVQEGVTGEFAQVINKSGAFVYKLPDTSSEIVQTLPYLSSVETFGEVLGNNKLFYQTKEGYISLYDTYNYNNNIDSYTYQQLKYGDVGSQVTILQNALEELYPNFNNYESGEFDNPTETYLKYFQDKNGLEKTGICDYYTWNVLLEATDNNNYFLNHVEVQTTYEPQDYTILYNSKTSIKNVLEPYKITINNKNTNQVKYTAIAVYKNGETKEASKTLTFEGKQTHSPIEFINMFNDDINYLTPTDVYYVVYPYGSTPYKWHFIIKEE